MWHKALKKVMCGDAHNEIIEVESIKDLPDTEQVELIAEKFAEVANLYMPLDRTKIFVPSFENKDIPVISILQVKRSWRAWTQTNLAEKLMFPQKYLKLLQMFCADDSHKLSIIALKVESGQTISSMKLCLLYQKFLSQKS